MIVEQHFVLVLALAVLVDSVVRLPVVDVVHLTNVVAEEIVDVVDQIFLLELIVLQFWSGGTGWAGRDILEVINDVLAVFGLIIK
jgi:hypothetical protein